MAPTLSALVQVFELHWCELSHTELTHWHLGLDFLGKLYNVEE